MAKKVIGEIKLQVGAGKANPAPPVGTALGPHGVNIMEFCKSFNAKTQSMRPGKVVPVIITVYADRSFTFIMKEEPVAESIKEAAGVQKGSGEPGKGYIAKITLAQVRQIAENKLKDMNTNNIESAMEMVKGTAVSMGIEVVE